MVMDITGIVCIVTCRSFLLKEVKSLSVEHVPAGISI
jgi:hypothetical protein